MSRRAKPPSTTAEAEVAKLRTELEELKNSARVADAAAIAMNANPGAHTFDALSPVEQSAASLGVSPDSWKPIQFLNNAHYQQLISSNMLDDDLARRIEAYRTVAAGGTTPA